jgi:hypothetical protein
MYQQFFRNIRALPQGAFITGKMPARSYLLTPTGLADLAGFSEKIVHPDEQWTGKTWISSVM